MACIKAQEWIHLHIDRSLDDRDEALLMDHLKDCDVCRKDFEILMSIHQVLQSTDEVDLPSGFHEEMMKKIVKRPKKRQNILFFKQLNIAAVIVFVLVFGLIGMNNLNQEKTSSDEVSEEMLSMSAISEDSMEVSVAVEATEAEDASLSRALNENERSQKATSDNVSQAFSDQDGDHLFGVRYEEGWMMVMVGGIIIIGLLIGYIKFKF